MFDFNGTEDRLSFCYEWTANERSHDENETGSCVCSVDESQLFNGTFLNYCHKWYCYQTEIDTSESYYCTENDDWAYKYYDSDHGWTYVCYETDSEHTDCECKRSSTNGLYCDRWYCEETSKSFDDKNIKEREWYQCVSNTSSNREYAQFDEMLWYVMMNQINLQFCFGDECVCVLAFKHANVDCNMID